MLSNKQTIVDNYQSQQNQQQESFTEILKKAIKDFPQWPAQKQMLAVSVVGGVFFVALPILLPALPLALTGAGVALTLFLAVKVASYLVEGIKWSAEKVVDGAKYSAHKIQAGAMYTKDKVKEGYEYSMDSLKRNANLVSEKTKQTTNNALEKTATLLYRAAGNENYLDKIKQFTPEQKDKSTNIRDQFKAIFDSPENNTSLIRNILSQIVEKIDSKIANETKDVDRWKEHRGFMSNLNTEKLQSLLTQRSLPKDSYLIDSIFFEHYNQIKEVIAECQESQTLLDISNMFKREEKEAKKSRSSSPFSSPSKKSSQKKSSVNIENLDSQEHNDITFTGSSIATSTPKTSSLSSSSNSYDSGKDSKSLLDEIIEEANKKASMSSATSTDSLVGKSNDSESSSPLLRTSRAYRDLGVSHIVASPTASVGENSLSEESSSINPSTDNSTEYLLDSQEHEEIKQPTSFTERFTSSWNNLWNNSNSVSSNEAPQTNLKDVGDAEQLTAGIAK